MNILELPKDKPVNGRMNKRVKKLLSDQGWSIQNLLDFAIKHMCEKLEIHVSITVENKTDYENDDNIGNKKDEDFLS